MRFLVGRIGAPGEEAAKLGVILGVGKFPGRGTNGQPRESLVWGDLARSNAQAPASRRYVKYPELATSFYISHITGCQRHRSRAT